MRFSRVFVTMLGVMICTSMAAAQTTQPVEQDEAQGEMVDNPQFTAWKKFGVGSTQTMESTMTANGQQMKMTTTQELKEKNDEKMVLTISGEMEMMGQKHAMPPQNQEVPAKAPDQKMKEVGHEKVSVAGETFDATVYEMETGNGMSAKVWFSDKVPGGVVQVTMSGPQGELKGELKKYQAK